MKFIRTSGKILFILSIIILTGCPMSDTDNTKDLTLNWSYYEVNDGSIILSWESSGGAEGHSYLLQRLTENSDWLPEDQTEYTINDSSVPGLIYSGSETSYTDSSVNSDSLYIYRLFAADGDLTYTGPRTITIKGLSVIQAPLLSYIKQMNYYVELAWQEIDSETNGYIVARSESPIDWYPDTGTACSEGSVSDDVEIIWTGDDNSCYDTEVQHGKTYFYRIFAYNSDFLYSTGLQCQIFFEEDSELLYDRFPRVDNYIIYYGPLDSGAISTAKQYDMAIIHPNNSDITRSQVRQIQRGFDAEDPSDDVLVIAYVAVGEDLRTTRFFDFKNPSAPPDYDSMLLEERFVRNGIGPRVDPRGPTGDGGELEYNYAIGDKSTGWTEGSGFASYYLDDNDTVNGTPDGKPDFNKSWGGAFVNAGDPLWFQEVDEMTSETDGICGLQELLTATVGKGLGVDGIFMDALDTCAPNSWTNSDSYVQNEFEWTAPGYADFIGRLKNKYPDKIVVQNRAVFFFRTGFTQNYLRYTTRPYIDFLLFESFRLNSSTAESYNEQYYNDNRYNYAPPLLAEAGRDDGFQILSLGYAEGPSSSLSSDLTSGTYNTDLIEDIEVTQNIGFRHYLSNIDVTHLNTYVLDYEDMTDTTPPVWSSVYNTHSGESPPGAPDQRAPLFDASSDTEGTITVYWDIAQDKYGVDYYLFYKTSPFDFSGNPDMDGISRVKLTPRIPEDYRTCNGALNDDIWPFYDDVAGFTSGQTYYLCIRPVDRSPNMNISTETANLYITVQ